MAKLVFVFVLALFALQGSNALLREDVAGNNVQELITELKKVIHDVTSRIADLYSKLKDKVVEIEDEANLPGLVSDFRQQVEQLMAQDGADVCETVARQEVREVMLQAAVISCKFEVNEEMNGLKKQLEVLATKVEQLLKEIGRDVYKCMKESHGNHDKFTQCMDQNIYNVKQELEIVEKEIEETFKMIEESMPVFTDKISTCVADNKEKLVARIQTAEHTIKSCVNGDNVALLRKDGAGNNVQELISELKKVIHDVTSRIAELYSELKDKVVEIEDEANFFGLVTDFRQQVKQLMAQDGADVCETVARQEVREVMRQASLVSCKFELNEEMNGLKKQLEVLATKVEQLLKEITRDVYKCMKESHGNQGKFTQCMDQNIYKIKQELEVVEKEIEETFKVIEESMPVFTDKISTCVADNKEKLIARIQTAEDTIKSCVNGDNVALLREDAASNNVQELISELNKIIHDVTSRFAELYSELKDKVVEIEDEANLPGLVSDFRQQVEQLMAQDGAEICETVARQEVREVMRQAAVVSCKLEVNEEMNGLRKQLEVLATKVEQLLKEITRDVYKCMKESHGNQGKFTQCMDQNIYKIKQELEVVEKEIEETFKVIEESMPVFTDKISTCVADNKEKLIARIQTAEDTIKSCVNGDNVALLREDAASNNVQELISELNKIIHDVTSRFAELYSELKDKVVEIEDEANLPGLVSDFRQQVEQLMAQDGAEICETVARQEVREVMRQAAVVSCKLEVNEEMNGLRKQLEVLATKVEQLLKEIGRDVYKCMKESHGNHDKFTQCMDQNIYNVKQELEIVEKQIEETFKVIEESMPAVTDKISTCVADNKNKLVARIQTAEETIKNCVNHANLLF